MPWPFRVRKAGHQESPGSYLTAGQPLGYPKAAEFSQLSYLLLVAIAVARHIPKFRDSIHSDSLTLISPTSSSPKIPCTRLKALGQRRSVSEGQLRPATGAMHARCAAMHRFSAIPAQTACSTAERTPNEEEHTTLNSSGEPCETTPQSAMLPRASGFPELLESPRQTETIYECESDASTQILDPLSVSSPRMRLDSLGASSSGQHFIDLNALSLLPMSDVHILVTGGCLDMPPKSAMDVFLMKYFLLVHPSVPILNEVEFWNTYLQSEDTNYAPKISLFSDPLARAQGALLLTFHTTAEDPQATMTWNMCAIHNATATGLGLHPSLQDPNRCAKKRLWWSIFVRDRFLWLGRHRRPQFTSANFSLNIDYLQEEEMTNEIIMSPFYEPNVKRLLLKVFQAQCRLAVILTDVITISFSASDGDAPRLSLQELDIYLTRIKQLRAGLAQWEETVYSPLHHTGIAEPGTVGIIINLTALHYQ
ncbi:unnamed protein product [Aspergillus oryzae var. brunneus]|uniref:Unnamed protein product n=2 Tax=Aspergillus oryzae TaxID=5062 RepID=A0AAN5BVY9_ASPOZ|nr:unnamed protein product [Aspergillus oryzae]GMG54224.1 unnamed protein product [Aspergillus oryzae var. brunneus]